MNTHQKHTGTTSPAMVSRLWKAGTVAVFPLSFLIATCKNHKTVESTNPESSPTLVSDTNLKNQENAKDRTAPHLLPGPLIGEGDEDVAGRLEGADDVVLYQIQRESERDLSTYSFAPPTVLKMQSWSGERIKY